MHQCIATHICSQLYASTDMRFLACAIQGDLPCRLIVLCAAHHHPRYNDACMLQMLCRPRVYSRTDPVYVAVHSSRPEHDPEKCECITGLALFDCRAGFLRASSSVFNNPHHALSMPRTAATYIRFWQTASASDSHNCLSSLSECRCCSAVWRSAFHS